MKNKTKKKWIRCFSFLLSLLMIFGAVPIYAEPLAPAAAPAERETNIDESVISEEICFEELSLEKNETNANTRSTSYNYQTVTKIPNGVYALQNYGNEGLWMDIEGDSTTPGMHMQQFAYSTSPVDGSSLAGLYRITQYGDTDRYIIRAMLDETLSFGIVGNEVLTKTIPADDEDVTDADTFYIEANGIVYTIKPYGSSQYIGANDTDASGWAGRPDSYLIPQSLATNFYQNLWRLQGKNIELEAGVYALQKKAPRSLWMDTEGDSYGEGAHIQQYDYGTSPAATFSRGGLFKITPYGNTGYYVIRLMTNNYLSFQISGNEFLTHKIHEFDDQVALSDTFSIQFYDGGYVLRPYGSPYCVASNHSTASGYEGRPNSYLVPEVIETAGYRACWKLEKYCGNNFASGGIRPSGSWIAGEQVEIAVTHMWSTSQNVSSMSLYIDDEYANIATYDWDEDTSILTAYCHDEGTFPLGIKYSGSPQTEDNTYLDSMDFTVSLPIEEGEYFFQNAELENYMQVDNDDADNGYDSSGAVLELFGFKGEDYQKFTLEHVVDGYYKIITVCGKVLSIHEDYVNDERHIWQAFYGGWDFQHWKFTKTSRGTYVIRLQSAEPYATDWCMAAGSVELFDDRNVEQREYDEDDGDYKDEWKLYSQWDYAVLLGYNENIFTIRNSFFSEVKQLLQTPQNEMLSIVDTNYYTSCSVNTMLNYLQNNNIFIIHTHGAQQSFKIGENSRLRMADLNGVNLSNLDMAILLTCNTGSGFNPNNITNNTPVNIVETMVICGAKTVVGFEDTTYVADCNKLAQELTQYMTEEQLSIQEAVDSIDFNNGGYLDDMSTFIIIAGDANNTIR